MTLGGPDLGPDLGGPDVAGVDPGSPDPGGTDLAGSGPGGPDPGGPAPGDRQSAPVERPAARVLLIDGTGRILLFHGTDPGRAGHTYWFTPGGGVDPGETMAEAAARELYEETGLRIDPARLTGPVYQDVAEFPFDGRWYRSVQEYFLLRVRSWRVAPTHQTMDERRSVDGHRWWTVDDLAVATEPYYPVGLADLLRRMSSGPPGREGSDFSVRPPDDGGSGGAGVD